MAQQWYTMLYQNKVLYFEIHKGLTGGCVRFSSLFYLFIAYVDQAAF